MSEVPNPTLSTAAYESSITSGIYHNIATNYADQNVAVSPLLLEATLSLLFLGSDGAFLGRKIFKVNIIKTNIF